MRGEFSVGSSEHFIVFAECALELFVVLDTSQSGVLAEIGDTINLVTISGSEGLYEVTRIEIMVDYCVGFNHHMRQENIIVLSRVIDERRLIREFPIFVEAVSLATLGIGPVRLLLDFVLAEHASCIFVTHGDSGGALLVKLFAVHDLAIMVHDFAGFEDYIFVVQVYLVDLRRLGVVVEIIVFHRLKLLVNYRYLSLFSLSVGVESRLLEKFGVVREQILGISEGVLFTSDASRALVWKLISERPPISYLVQG